ncbi:myotubularin-related protein 6-like [Oscarella lobularis]|uniref:myotubularin-related protein 6-like n=1 Tax=Oscarella lobularis TaxID=121494 RepID=UPI00331351B4
MDLIKTPKVDDVHLQSKISPKKSTKGTLYMTATHLIFHDTSHARETWLLHTHIQSLDTLPINTKGSPLKIVYKTFQSFTFIIPKDRECQDVYNTLSQLSKPESFGDLYAFRYVPQSKKFEKENGWKIFDHTREFMRMGVPNECWRYSSANENFELCSTYPNWTYVPSSASDDLIQGSAKFRSRSRVPVLTYFHAETQSAMCRSSQPLVGMNRRSSDDEKMLLLMAEASPSPSKQNMYVVDTRPKINAMANKAAGKGYESEGSYEKMDLKFIGIQNIHVMRDSLQKLTDVARNPNLTMSEFLTGLAGSGWLKHIRGILETSIFIAKALGQEGRNVLVHCSDGWDRTAQTCSLASLMLDPYYRTVHGFQVLICKEWLAFGHKFSERCGHLGDEPREVSPVFLQFLDAVWQLQQQFPCSFQFSEKFLLEFHSHVHSCQYGTFLGNNERQRKELKLSERTYSFWGYVWEHINDFLNPLYKPMSDFTEGMLTPDLHPHNIQYWRGMYNQHDSLLLPRESWLDRVAEIVSENESKRKEKSLLEQEIRSLKGKAHDVANAGITATTEKEEERSDVSPTEDS